MQQVTTTFSGYMNGSYRPVSNGVLVSWDKTTASGVNYFTVGSSVIGGSDILKTTGGGTIAQAQQYKYSTIPASGVVSWSTSMSLNQYPYGLVQRQADVTLVNADKRYLPASGTALGPYIDSGRPLVIQAGFGGETIPMFTGYTDSPVNDIGGRTITMHAYDAVDYLNSYNSKATVPQLNQRKDQIIATLLQEAGFGPNQYILERSLDSPLPYFDPFGKMIGDIIKNFCEAEGAIFFADETGIMHYWNRQHFSDNATPVATLTYSNMQTLQQQNSPVINYVNASSNPLTLISGTSQIYSLSQPYYLQANGNYSQNQIANPSFEVSTSGWQGNISRTNAQAYVGNYSASGNRVTYDLSPTATVSSDGVGSQVSFQAQVKPTAGSVTFSLLGNPVPGSNITGTTTKTISGTTWQQVSLNGSHFATSSLGGVSTWANIGSLPVGKDNFGLTTFSGFVYLIGGDEPSAPTNHVYYAPTSNPTSFSLTSSLADTYEFGAAATVGNYIYFMGGQGSNGSDVPYTWYAKPNPDGSLPAWAATANINTAKESMGAVSYSGSIYLLGGYTGTQQVNDVIYAKPNTDGTVSSWASTTALPTALNHIAAVTASGYMYATGGFDGYNSVATVYYAPINANGTVGSWASTTALPTALHGHRAFINNGYLYVLAGKTVVNNNSGTPSNAVYYAPINANGTVGSWASTNSFAIPRVWPGVYVNGNTTYLLGGYSPSPAPTEFSDVQSAAFLSTGVTVSGNGSANFYIDAAATDVTTSYFDGDTSGNQLYNYAWTGTRGLSQSVRTAIPHYLSIAVPLNYNTYTLVQPVASGLNNATIGPKQSYYSFSSISGTGGIYGADLTANVSLQSYTVSGTTAYLTFQNNSSNQAYLTNLVLYGQVAQAGANISQSYSNQNSINTYRLNPTNGGQIMTISNDYIPTAGDALGLSEYLVQGFSTPYLKHTTDVFTRPNIQFGDCVQLVNRDTGETRIGYVMGLQNSADSSGLKQQLIIQEKNLANYFTIGVSTIGSTSQIAP